VGGRPHGSRIPSGRSQPDAGFEVTDERLGHSPEFRSVTYPAIPDGGVEFVGLALPCLGECLVDNLIAEMLPAPLADR
jgi:hypothetical protein